MVGSQVSPSPEQQSASVSQLSPSRRHTVAGVHAKPPSPEGWHEPEQQSLDVMQLPPVALHAEAAQTASAFSCCVDCPGSQYGTALGSVTPSNAVEMALTHSCGRPVPFVPAWALP